MRKALRHLQDRMRYSLDIRGRKWGEKVRKKLCKEIIVMDFFRTHKARVH